MSEPSADDLKEHMAMYDAACREPAREKKPRRKSGNKKAAVPPASSVIFGRELRDASDIAHIEIPPELRVDPAKVHVDALMVEQLSDIAERPVEWLWRDRFPLGRLSLLAGDPGIGKSLVALDIAARVSCGAPWPDHPDEPQEPGNVIVFSMEDNLSDTIKPRLIRAGADCRRAFVVEGVFNRPPYLDLQWKRRFRIREDLNSLKKLVVAAAPVRLIVLDPIAAYCGNGDGGGMSVVHSMLSPLLEMAANCGISILCTTHLSRGASGKAVYRAARHLSFTTAARAVWSIVRDARDSARRLVVPVKINLGPDVEGLAFRIDAEGKVVWESEPVNVSADRALEAEREASKLDRTIEWLRGVLQEGPQEAPDIIEKGKDRGFSESTVRRAGDSLGVKTKFKGFSANRISIWSLEWSPPWEFDVYGGI